MAITQRPRAAPTSAPSAGRLRRVAELVSELPESEYASPAARKATVSRGARFGRKHRIDEVISELSVEEYEAAGRKKADFAIEFGETADAIVCFGKALAETQNVPERDELVQNALRALGLAVGESKPPYYTDGPMDNAAAKIAAAARTLLGHGVKELPGTDLNKLLRVVAAEIEARETTGRATAEPRSEDGRPVSTPGNFPTRATLTDVGTSPAQAPPSGPRLVTADELFGDVLPSQRSKPRQKYQFAPELLNDPKALGLAKSIANARNYKVRKGITMAEEEDARGKMAESFVKQAERRQRKSAGTPIPSPG